MDGDMVRMARNIRDLHSGARVTMMPADVDRMREMCADEFEQCAVRQIEVLGRTLYNVELRAD